MKVTEEMMHNITTKAIESMKDLTRTTTHSTCDAFNDKVRVEYKARRGKLYEDTLIELNKVKNNVCYNKDFVYAVAVQGNIYYFHITRMLKEKYNFNWGKLDCPKHTDVGTKGKKIIAKNVGYLKMADADAVVDIKTQKRIK